MLTISEHGLYCPAGDFYIDPWRSVERAVITHGHGDHARTGSRAYLCAQESVGILRLRLGMKVVIEGRPYGEVLTINGVRVSFHPAGHILGSAQIRLEHGGEIWVASGDYKRQPDPTCAPFEPLRCHTFLTECTFGLPLYRWPDTALVVAEIKAWWEDNRRAGRTSLLYAYSLGKAQRLLVELGTTAGPILAHPAICALLPAYTAAGVALPPVAEATPLQLHATAGQALVMASPGLAGDWLEAAGPIAGGFASGWMLLRKARRGRQSGRGFPISDHADWPALLQTIRETGAERILVTHGQTGPLVRWLNENGWSASALPTRFEGEKTDRAGGESS